jgi:hypothetical protein
MLIKIHDHHTKEKTFYYWELYDGPDGIDEAKGFAVDLIEVFSKIIEWRERIGNDYAQEVLQDLKNTEQFIKNNETNT